MTAEITRRPQKVLQPRSTRLSRRVRKSDRMMLIQQPVIRNFTGIGISFGSAPAGVRTRVPSMPERCPCQ